MDVGVTSAARLPNSFAANCFSAHLKKIESSQLFRCRKLVGHGKVVLETEFSEDGSLLVSGGWEPFVRLWSLNQNRNGECTPIAIMETMHKGDIRCLAFSPDNRRIFSGSDDKKVLIHDIRS